MASDISVTNASGGTAVPIATLRDSTSSVAAVHVSGYSVGGVATPVDSSHPLPITVANFPTTQPVSIASALGVTQSGSWTVALSGGNATAIKVDGSLVTQPVSASALPLPAGAATAGNQPALNTDGGALSHVTNFPATQPVSVAAPVAVTQSGNWTVSTGGIIPTWVHTNALSASQVLKSAAGSLSSVYVTTGSVAGYLMLFDATAAPADGSVAPADAVYCPATATTTLDYSTTPLAFATGIVAVFSSTGPFTKTASATVFIKGGVQ